MKYNIRIIGHGMTVPKHIVYSKDMYQNALDTKEVNMYGVKTRYWSVDESNSSMAANALQKALNKADLAYEKLDLIIYASATYDYPLPSTACLIPQHLHKEHLNTPCLDVNSSCLSFLTAMEMMASLITTGNYKCIAIVSSEISSKSIDKTNPETYGLFGDGAAAFIFNAGHDQLSALSDFKFNTYPKGALYTYVPAGGNILHRNKHTPDSSLFNFHMQGSKVLKFTTKMFIEFIDEYEKKYGQKLKDYPLIIPHQASKASLDFLIRSCHLKREQVYITLEDYGNCVAASIPMALCGAIDNGKVKRGDEVLLLGTAAGISIGAVKLMY